MKKILVIAIVGISLSAFGQTLTNLNNAKLAGAVVDGLTWEVQEMLQVLVRANNKASKALTNWTVVEWRTNAVGTNLVGYLYTNNPPLKLEAVLRDALKNEKISRVIYDYVATRTTAIAKAFSKQDMENALSDPTND